MRLTPLEIRKQTFARKRIGGVDPEEVQDFLNLVASELEETLRENALQRERLEAAQQKIQEFRTLEETLRRTLVRAERMSNESKDTARREGELILEQASVRAERVLADARARLRQLTAEIQELQKKKDVFVHRFTALVQRQLELLGQHGSDYEDLSQIAEEANEALARHDHPVYVSAEAAGPRRRPRGDDPGPRGPSGRTAPREPAPGGPRAATRLLHPASENET